MRVYVQSSTMANGKCLICRVCDGAESTTQTNKPPGDNDNSETRHNTRNKPEMVSCISL